jgi:hypothetical protein
MEKVGIFSKLVPRELHSAEKFEEGNGCKKADHRLTVAIQVQDSVM